ncbi:hypothetical protein DV515_00014219 [Chloebia gouldiae]|uniref:Uncharacterized protein n=1 Tax=Chloebia gouldiae TaxID=44316 RepID=A0A3L8S006_CHLGU|nr:hypothetical protein DV515_00014219 [Chloebia gouldiae]
MGRTWQQGPCRQLRAPFKHIVLPKQGQLKTRPQPCGTGQGRVRLGVTGRKGKRHSQGDSGQSSHCSIISPGLVLNPLLLPSDPWGRSTPRAIRRSLKRHSKCTSVSPQQGLHQFTP